VTRLRASAASAAKARFTERFVADVQYYLTQQPRQLPSRYLYDDLGTALFEAICRLPWYPITRGEQRLLARHGADILRQTSPSRIVELGSGSGEKLKLLLESAQGLVAALRVDLIDLSPAALDQAARTLAPLDWIEVTPYAATYEAGLEEASRAFSDDDHVLALFLGSNIGNFDPPSCEAFLRGVRALLRQGDQLLLGVDLVKPERRLTLAYDDPLGVTAAFNRNLLVRVNRELDANFELDRFDHRAVWNMEASRVEMHLVARSAQEVSVRAADLSFTIEPGEYIWTESSYKYEREDITRLLTAGGFHVAAQWIDESARFALTLADAI
jgi:dimethylhistidine N-methyltransferase